MSNTTLIQSIINNTDLSSKQKLKSLKNHLNKAAKEMSNDRKRPEIYESLKDRFLHIATNLNCVEAVQFLLDNNVDPDETRNFRQYTGMECAGTSLSDAAGDGSIAIMDLLVQRGADTEVTNVCGWTPLHEAIDNNQWAAAERLLTRHKANVHAKLGAGCNILHLLNTKDTAEKLLAYLNSVGQLESLINETDEYVTSPFCDAIYSGREAVALVYLEKYADKVDINKPDTRGNTALHYAVKLGSKLLVKKLLEHGARIIPNKKNATPLAWAHKKYETNHPIYQALYNHQLKTTGIVFAEPKSPKKDCARKYVRTKEVADSSSPQNNNNAHHKTHVKFVHKSKNDAIKFQFSLDTSQHGLRETLNQLPHEDGNSIVANISFEIAIVDSTGNKKRDIITFPLKIPASLPAQCSTSRQTENSQDISYSYVKEKQSLQSLGELYRHGLTVVGGHSHGPAVDYSGKKRAQEQYIYHTEQILAAYLCKPEASTMLVNRLISEIRAKYSDLDFGTTIKLYNSIISFHSNKTPCAPCEYVMVGLQNSYSIVTNRFTGFTRLLEQELDRRTEACTQNQPNNHLKFNYPKRNKQNPDNDETIQLFFLYTADETDAGHKVPVVPSDPLFNDNQPTYIATKSPSKNPHIFLANYGKTLDEANLNSGQSDLSQRSVLVSGSTGTKQNKQKAEHAKELKNQELDSVLGGIKRLFR